MCIKNEIGLKIPVMVDGEEKYLIYLGLSNEIKKDGTRKGSWECFCGKKFNCEYRLIKKGIRKSCGHIDKIYNKRKIYEIEEVVIVEIRGQNFELKYLGKPNPEKYSFSFGEWLCFCNKIWTCRNYDITSGKTRSCGHTQKIYEIGEIVQVKIKEEIKELKYLRKIDNNQDGSTIGEWLCFCGSIFETENSGITSGNTKSCGKWCWTKKYDDYSNTDLIKCKFCNNSYTKDNFKWDHVGRITRGGRCDICRKLHNGNYQKNKRKNDPKYKLRQAVSASIRDTIKNNNGIKSKSTFEALDYTPDQLKHHLESKFEDWMSWENWKVYDPNTWNDNDKSTWVWNLDHIKPHSTFNYVSLEDQEFKNCWSLSNLRPYSAKNNLLDGANKTRHK